MLRREGGNLNLRDAKLRGNLAVRPFSQGQITDERQPGTAPVHLKDGGLTLPRRDASSRAVAPGRSGQRGLLGQKPSPAARSALLRAVTSGNRRAPPTGCHLLLQDTTESP